VTFDAAVARLEDGLRSALPGADAQARLAPSPPRTWPAGFNPARVRNAAGLLLVFPNRSEQSAERFVRDRDEPHIILTVRADALRHGGQVSLPGGVVDPGETFEQTALREAHEEVALPLEPVRIVGALTPLDIPVSGFRLHPIVAVTPAPPQLTPSDGEVARILDVAVADLMDPRHFATIERQRDGLTFAVPAFRIAGVEIWGATAMVLAEFLTLLGWPGPSTS
jgi:8-oxo-dGTP pyrophosphatase MutT (NUDIX family)